MQSCDIEAMLAHRMEKHIIKTSFVPYTLMVSLSLCRQLCFGFV